MSDLISIISNDYTVGYTRYTVSYNTI